MVCTMRAKKRLRHSDTARAKISEGNRPTASFHSDSVMVFLITLRLAGLEKNCSKYLYQGVTHGLPRIPFLMLNFLKAMTRPYMGAYLYTRK